MNEPRFTQASSAFSLLCKVALHIRARPETIWSLLTDGKGFPRWKSTITRLEGEIREGERLRLHVPGTDRTFTPVVSGLVPRERMSWSGGFAPLFKGVRSFQLRSRDDGSVDFTLEERFSGLLLPLVRRSLPDFRPVFERFASDLKKEAERAEAGSASRLQAR